MDSLFNFDHPFWSGMEKVFDIFVLNTLWLLCSLPVFTIGPSTAAFFYSMIGLVRGEDRFVGKDFFQSFRQNFRQGIALGLPLTAVGIFLLGDMVLCFRAGTGIYTFFMVFFFVMFLIWASVTLYCFPLLAKFHKTNGELLAWAYTLSIRRFPLTLLMLGTLGIAVWACHILSGLVFIAFGAAGYFQAVILCSVLTPFLPSVSGKEPSTPLNFDITEEQTKTEE